MASCEQCNGPMDGKRAGSRTCSPACRVALGRRLSVTDEPVSVTNAKCNTPDPVTLSKGRKCGPIPGDPDYDGVALQERFRDHWVDPDKVEFRPDDEPTSVQPRPLPDGVPDVVVARYSRDSEDEYRATINRLLTSSIQDLCRLHVSIPTWRYQME